MGTQRERLVLIVEDDLGLVMWLASKLREAGCGVLPAKEPSEAARLLTKMNRQPDLLVIDASNSDVLVTNRLINALPDVSILALIGGSYQAYRTLTRVDAAVMRPNTFVEASLVLRNIERLLTRHFTA